MKPTTAQEGGYYDVVLDTGTAAAPQLEQKLLEKPSKLLGFLLALPPARYCIGYAAGQSTIFEGLPVLLTRVVDASVARVPVTTPGELLDVVTEGLWMRSTRRRTV